MKILSRAPSTCPPEYRTWGDGNAPRGARGVCRDHRGDADRLVGPGRRRKAYARPRCVGRGWRGGRRHCLDQRFGAPARRPSGGDHRPAPAPRGVRRAVAGGSSRLSFRFRDREDPRIPLGKPRGQGRRRRIPRPADRRHRHCAGLSRGHPRPPPPREDSGSGSPPALTAARRRKPAAGVVALVLGVFLSGDDRIGAQTKRSRGHGSAVLKLSRGCRREVPKRPFTDRCGRASGGTRSSRAGARCRRSRSRRARCPCRSPSAGRCRTGAGRGTSGSPARAARARGCA
jgi:hypothetical protein